MTAFADLQPVHIAQDVAKSIGVPMPGPDGVYMTMLVSVNGNRAVVRRWLEASVIPYWLVAERGGRRRNADASSRDDGATVRAPVTEEEIKFRPCGKCGVRDIPRGIEWPWWIDGCCVHLGCMFDDTDAPEPNESEEATV